MGKSREKLKPARKRWDVYGETERLWRGATSVMRVTCRWRWRPPHKAIRSPQAQKLNAARPNQMSSQQATPPNIPWRPVSTSEHESILRLLRGPFQVLYVNGLVGSAGSSGYSTGRGVLEIFDRIHPRVKHFLYGKVFNYRFYSFHR